MTLGEKIKMHRKALGLTQTELGRKLGVQVNAVSKWECGKTFNKLQWKAIILLLTIFLMPMFRLGKKLSSEIVTRYNYSQYISLRNIQEKRDLRWSRMLWCPPPPPTRPQPVYSCHTPLLTLRHSCTLLLLLSHFGPVRLCATP